MSVDRCGGSGEFSRTLTPRLDPRDPAFEVDSYACPGCPDCLAGQTVTDPAVVAAVSRHNVWMEIVPDGVRVLQPGDAPVGYVSAQGSNALRQARDRIASLAISGENVPGHPASFGAAGEAYNDAVSSAMDVIDQMIKERL